MIDRAVLPDMEPYALAHDAKQAFLSDALLSLTRHHTLHCPQYARMLRAANADLETFTSYAQLPPLPVRLFKEFDLKSVADDAVTRTMTSSGTTGQQVSKIYLDRETAVLQSKVLGRIVGSALGNRRLPMIIADTEAVLKDPAMFSARGAGIRGFSLFGRDAVFALDGDMRLRTDALEAFVQKHAGETIFLFGFTSILWQHVYGELHKAGKTLGIADGVLIHGGGWKKLADQAVDKQAFKQGLRSVCGNIRVLDYYGMVEQTGTIYLECEHGRLHAPVWSDVLIRRPFDLSLAEPGEAGLIEVVSVLAESYPGHVLLTEDEGRVLGEDDCPCGRMGKYFTVLGRIRRAETRGCSDTYEQP